MDAYSPSPPASPPKSRPAMLVLVLATGLILGAALDRAAIWFTSQRSVLQTQLLGKWVHQPDGEPLEFFADGTFATHKVVFDMTGNTPNGVKKERTLGQWRWLDHERIEMKALFAEAPKRVVINGNVLKLIGSGVVHEYRRE